MDSIIQGSIVVDIHVHIHVHQPLIIQHIFIDTNLLDKYQMTTIRKCTYTCPSTINYFKDTEPIIFACPSTISYNNSFLSIEQVSHAFYMI